MKFVEMPFSVLPPKTDTYLLVHHDDYYDAERSGMHSAIQYTAGGGWNTHIGILDGEVYKDAEMSIEYMAESYKCWLYPIDDDSDRWADRLDMIREEAIEKMAPPKDEDDRDYAALDELIHYLDKAIEFAEVFK